MSNPPTPLTPNFIPGVGQLVTYRVDFESHILGTDFRQKANTVDMFPLITIGGGQPTNVQDAIAALAAIIAPSSINPATPTTYGTIKLAGDLGGSGTSGAAPRVSGIQGYPINITTTPLVGQVLTWNGGYWAPAGSSGFAASGDLSGSSSSQTVIGLQGRTVSNTAPTSGQSLAWNGTAWIPTTIGGSGTSGPAGGDLSGTYPNPTVARLQGNAVSSTVPTTGQVLTWNGSAWAPGSSSSGTLNGDVIGPASSNTVNGISGALGSWNWAPTGNAVIQFLRPISDTGTRSLIIEGQDAFPSAVSNVNGGNIAIYTGTPTVGGQPGSFTLQLGFGVQNVLNATPGETVLVGAGTNSITLDFSLTTITVPIQFANSVISPALTQAATGSATGAAMTISAQNAATTGGRLNLSSGNAPTKGTVGIQLGGVDTLTVAPSITSLYPGAGSQLAYGFNPYHGTINTQIGSNNIYPCFASTTGGGSDVNLVSIPIANNKIMMVEVVWVRRSLTSATDGYAYGNRAGITVTCNSSGGVNSSAVVVVYSGSGFALFTDIIVDTSVNHVVTFKAHADSVANLDWQAIITVTAC